MQLRARVASPKGGKVHYQIDGKDWGSGVIPNTGSFQNWRTVRLAANPYQGLEPGNHVLRVIFDDSGVAGPIANFNWFRIVPAAGTGTGTVAEYYNSTHFTAPAFTRTDRTINFNWGTGWPDPRVGADTFSVFVRRSKSPPPAATPSTPRPTMVYAFTSTRLSGIASSSSINGPTSPVLVDGTFDMVAGTKWGIILEYFENTGNASAKLQWSGPNVPKQVIPATQLYPVDSDVTPTAPFPIFMPPAQPAHRSASPGMRPVITGPSAPLSARNRYGA